MSLNSPFLDRALAFMKNFTMDVYDQVQWTETQLLELIDVANIQVFEERLRAQEAKTYTKWAEATITVVAGTEDYNWPGNYRKFLRLIKYNSNGEIENELKPADYQLDLPGIIIMPDRGFRIRPNPNSALAGDWTLVYEAGAVATLHYGNAAGGSTSTLQMDATPTKGHMRPVDNFYVNSFVHVFDGNAAGDIRRITAQSGSTLTVTPNFTGAVASPDQYEILPCVSYPLDIVIPLNAAVNLPTGRGDVRQVSAIERLYERKMATVLDQTTDAQGKFGPSMGEEGTDFITEYANILW